MTLQELMERLGSRETGKVKIYLQDAIREIGTLFPDKTTGTTIDVVADTLMYTLPTDMVKLLGVYRRYDSQGHYIRIGHVRNIEFITNSTGP